MRLGGRGNLLDPAPYKQLFLPSPVLLESEMEFIKYDEELKSQVVKLFYDGKFKYSGRLQFGSDLMWRFYF